MIDLLPVLFDLGGYALHTFGLLLAVGVVIGVSIAYRDLKRRNMDPGIAYDLAIYALIGGLFGARLTYVAGHLADFASRPLAVLAIWEGGLIFYGGLIGGAAAVLLYIRIRKLPLGQTADVMAMPLAVGSAVGRLGCFANGCCYGVPTEGVWGVVFTDPRSAIASAAPDLLGHLLQPTQLIEAAYNFGILAILWAMRKRVDSDGLLFWIFIGLYGAFRFLVEFIRVKPVVILGLGGSQLFSLALVVAAAAVIGIRYVGGRDAIGNNSQA
ncbi:MAG: prolipoprotein diacylglyceryl transferase [Candidatus Aquicultorales bacterium]